MSKSSSQQSENENSGSEEFVFIEDSFQEQKPKKKKLQPLAVQQEIEQVMKKASEFSQKIVSHLNARSKPKPPQRLRRNAKRDQNEDEEEKQCAEIGKQPTILKGGELKDFQINGLNWMISLYQSGVNGILADDMGLGKTIQTISMIAFIRETKKIKGPHLILGPKITLSNWKREFAKWLPEVKTATITPTMTESTRQVATRVLAEEFDVLLTNYETIIYYSAMFTKIKWHYIVIDEAHKIKNDQSKLSVTIRTLKTHAKLLLTGTPLQNNLHQLWSLLNFLLPQVFKSSDVFDFLFEQTQQKQQNETETQRQAKNVQMINKIHAILQPFLLRRTKKQVQKCLPSKKQIMLYTGITDLQLQMYKQVLEKTPILGGGRNIVSKNVLMDLRKICNHPYLFPGVENPQTADAGPHLIENSGKMILLDKLLQKLYQQKTHKVIIFSQFVGLLNILEDYCYYRKYEYNRIDGVIHGQERDKQIQEFVSNPNKFIFLITTKAGGVGINLTVADTVIIYDSDWNPQNDLQAMDRAHRIGQKKNVNVYRLVTENTIEQKIIQRQMIKLKWDSLVIQQSKHNKSNGKLQAEDMRSMLQFGASVILKAQKGTLTDEQIQSILKRGEDKTNEINCKLNEVMDKKSNIADLSLASISIFNNIMPNKDKQDRQTLEMLANKSVPTKQNDDFKKTRARQKIDYTEGTNVIEVFDFQLFTNIHKLRELIDREGELTKKQAATLERLLSSGFVQWTKDDFQNFLLASEKFGKKNVGKIAEFVGKDVDQVRQYHQAFWKRIKTLENADQIIQRLKKSDDINQKIMAKNQMIEWKKKMTYNLVDFDEEHYKKFATKKFSRIADRIIFTEIMFKGSERMDQIKEAISRDPRLRFDLSIKIKTESQLIKRFETLLKVCSLQKKQQQQKTMYPYQTPTPESPSPERRVMPLGNRFDPPKNNESSSIPMGMQGDQWGSGDSEAEGQSV